MGVAEDGGARKEAGAKGFELGATGDAEAALETDTEVVGEQAKLAAASVAQNERRQKLRSPNCAPNS